MQELLLADTAPKLLMPGSPRVTATLLERRPPKPTRNLPWFNEAMFSDTRHELHSMPFPWFRLASLLRTVASWPEIPALRLPKA